MYIVLMLNNFHCFRGAGSFQINSISTYTECDCHTVCYNVFGNFIFYGNVSALQAGSKHHMLTHFHKNYVTQTTYFVVNIMAVHIQYTDNSA